MQCDICGWIYYPTTVQKQYTRKLKVVWLDRDFSREKAVRIQTAGGNPPSGT
jgi:hypothetical protein